jgi:hypothetical protein
MTCEADDSRTEDATFSEQAQHQCEAVVTTYEDWSEQLVELAENL